MKRQALHSKSLTFYHPIFREMSFTIKLPSDMRSVVAKGEQNSYIIKNFVPFS